MLSQQREQNKSRKTNTETRKHASKACQQCRKRKAKCDGKQPTCSTCTLYRDDCTWTTEQDGRKAAKKGEVAALRERVKLLESMLKKSGDEAFQADDLAKVRTELESEDEDSDEELKDITDGAGINRLRIDAETMELTAYGPTSAFQHLPEPLPRQVSTSPDSNFFSRSPLPSTSSVLHPLLHGMASPSAPSPSSSANGLSPTPEPTFEGPIDWSRNLPDLEGWDETLHDDLLKHFFAYFNGWCYWVEEAPFRRDLTTCLSLDDNSSTPSRTSYFSPLLHSAILAIACHYSDDPRTDSSSSLSLVTTAKRALDEEGERPTIATLRGLLLLGSWHSGNALQGGGNIYAGIALRMSQTLGLGIDSRGFVRNGVLSESLQKSRDLAMWSCYCQDKLWASFVGRNPTLLLQVLETPPPSINSVLDSTPWTPLARNGRRPPPCSLTLCFHTTTRLLCLQEQVLNTLYGLRTNVQSPAILNRVSELNLKLEAFMSKLPDALRIPPQLTKPPPAHIITLNCLFSFVVILLHRPYYQGEGVFNEAAVKRCNSAASRIVSLLELYQQAPGLRFAPVTLTQIAFAAGTSHLLHSVNSIGQKAIEAIEASRCVVSALKEMGKSWKCATQTGQILEKLIEEWAPKNKGKTPSTHTNHNNDSSRSLATAPSNPPNPEQLLDPHSDLAKELVRLGWQPPTSTLPSLPLPSLPPSVSTATHPSYPTSPSHLPHPSPQPNPLSLQHGFASAFSQPTTNPYHCFSTQQPQQAYDPSQTWIDPSFQLFAPPNHPHQGGSMPDDVFAGLLSFAGRSAMGGIVDGSKSEDLSSAQQPWWN